MADYKVRTQARTVREYIVKAKSAEHALAKAEDRIMRSEDPGECVDVWENDEEVIR